MNDERSSEHLEFYSASVNAWFSSSLEHDKSLLTLSAGGIGLLITLLTTVGLKTYLALILYTLAILGFLVCLIAVLLIFNANRKYIVKLFQGDEHIEDNLLKRLDNIAIWSFGFAVVFTATIGITTAYQEYKQKGQDMSVTKKGTSVGIVQNSFQGAKGLQKSFNGAQQLKPSATSNTTPVSTSATQTNQTQSPVPTEAKK